MELAQGTPKCTLYDYSNSKTKLYVARILELKENWSCRKFADSLVDT